MVRKSPGGELVKEDVEQKEEEEEGEEEEGEGEEEAT
jgi:hypothetical protein